MLLLLLSNFLLLPFHQFSKVQVQRLCNEEPTAGLCYNWHHIVDDNDDVGVHDDEGDEDDNDDDNDEDGVAD